MRSLLRILMKTRPNQLSSCMPAAMRWVEASLLYRRSPSKTEISSQQYLAFNAIDQQDVDWVEQTFGRTIHAWRGN